MTKKAGKSSTAWFDKHGLSDKRRLFVLSYLEPLNTAEAAREAGYKHPYRRDPECLNMLGSPEQRRKLQGLLRAITRTKQGFFANSCLCVSCIWLAADLQSDLNHHFNADRKQTDVGQGESFHALLIQLESMRSMFDGLVYMAAAQGTVQSILMLPMAIEIALTVSLNGNHQRTGKTSRHALHNRLRGACEGDPHRLWHFRSRRSERQSRLLHRRALEESKDGCELRRGAESLGGLWCWPPGQWRTQRELSAWLV